MKYRTLKKGTDKIQCKTKMFDNNPIIQSGAKQTCKLLISILISPHYQIPLPSKRNLTSTCPLDKILFKNGITLTIQRHNTFQKWHNFIIIIIIIFIFMVFSL